MNIYLLVMTDEDNLNYDCNQGFVIAAEYDHIARNMAQENIADERIINRLFWLDPKFSKCSVLARNVKHEEGLILTSFIAG